MPNITLEQIAKLLDERFKPVNKKLGEHTERLDAITAELHRVHTMASSTLDLLKVTREKLRPAVDEVREHLGLPPID